MVLLEGAWIFYHHDQAITELSDMLWKPLPLFKRSIY